jgi:hypothetical protein
LINEEVSHKTCSFAVRVGTVTEKELIRALKKFLNMQMQKLKQKKGAKQATIASTTGKQTVKQLIGQGQGVQSIPIDKAGLGDFEKITRKYGVSFAVVKDKATKPPSYLVFFKAKDVDAITQVVKEYTARKLKHSQQKKPSVLQKLKKYKDLVASIPKKVHEKMKERER